MQSKASLVGHPIHPMLVSFPIAFYAASAVCFITYAINSNVFWFRVGFVSNVAGVVMALVAAVPGLIDLTRAIPKDSAAKDTGKVHMILQVIALIFFGLNIIAQQAQWNDALPSAGGAVFLTVVGFLFTVAAGFFGFTLVQRHHVGVDMTTEQERLEPRRTTPRAS